MTDTQRMRHLAKVLRRLEEGDVILDPAFAREAAALLDKYATCPKTR